jgi:hypothetical protein
MRTTDINNTFSLRNLGLTNAFHTVSLPRHRWYYYKEGFSPRLVEHAIRLANLEQTDVILDPFNGGGTTTLTAAINGYRSIGIEVNPFTSFLAKAKVSDVDSKRFEVAAERVLSATKKSKSSPLKGFSTFSKKDGIEKWLFNDEVLDAFEAGWIHSSSIESSSLQALIRLALISSAMANCNAVRDGKCLRYRKTWASNKRDKRTYSATLKVKLAQISADLQGEPLQTASTILEGDVRKVLDRLEEGQKFRLCITSPPYLNTFDYTDIYRPELFLCRYVCTTKELYKLRLQTVRSHLQAMWEKPKSDNFGALYDAAIAHVNANPIKLMDSRIPTMIQAYFEDMATILRKLRLNAVEGAQMWLVVSNSAYADKEIPVDLIIADIGCKFGWKLKEVAVLENIKRRKTVHSPSVKTLRESVIIFETAEFPAQ